MLSVSTIASVAISAAYAVSQALLLVFTGIVAFKLGLMGPTISSALGKITVKIFVPSLLFSSIAPKLKAEDLLSFAGIGVFAFCFTMSFALSAVLIYLALHHFAPRFVHDVSSDALGAAMVAITFPNSASIALALVQSVFGGDAAEGLEARLQASAYVMVYFAVVQVLLYSVGLFMLSTGRDKASSDDMAVRHNSNGSSSDFHQDEKTGTPLQHHHDSDCEDGDVSAGMEKNVVENITEYDLYVSERENSEDMAAVGIESIQEESHGQENIRNGDLGLRSSPPFAPTAAQIVWSFCKERVLPACVILLQRLATPPFIAIFLASFVALVPFLRALFYVKEGRALLQPLSNTIETLGGACVPVIMMVLGATVLQSSAQQLIADRLNAAVLRTDDDDEVNTDEASVSSVSREQRTTQRKQQQKALVVAGVVLLRLIVSPCLGVLSVHLLHVHFGYFADPLMQFVMMVQTANPSASSLVILSSLAGIAEKETSRLLFWQYPISVVPLTLTVFVAMLLTGVGA